MKPLRELMEEYIEASAAMQRARHSADMFQLAAEEATKTMRRLWWFFAFTWALAGVAGGLIVALSLGLLR